MTSSQKILYELRGIFRMLKTVGIGKNYNKTQVRFFRKIESFQSICSAFFGKSLQAVTLAFIFIANPVAADWIKVEATSDGDVYYIDLTTIRKQGSRRKVWELIDLSEPGPKGERSMRIYSEYDCKDTTKRILTFSEHSSSKANGRVIDDNYGIRPSDFSAIPPQTVAETVKSILCDK
jgi:hypothetical protein